MKSGITKNYTFVDYATQAYAAVVALLILCFHNETVPHWGLLVGAQIAILITVHCCIQAHSRGIGGKALGFIRHFYPVLLYTWFFCETGWLNLMFFSEYKDPLAIRWEQSLFGCQPSVLFMQKLPYLAVSEVFYAAYFSYYVMITGVGLALFVRNRSRFFHYVSVVSFVFYCCYLIYIFVPIIGPRLFFQEVGGYNLPQDVRQLATSAVYPDTVKMGLFYKLMAVIYANFEAPGSAIPSSHVAITWCTVFFTFKYLPRIRYVHAADAVLLCLATIYCRYHYVVDVLAGLLTALLLVPLGNYLYLRFGKPTFEIARDETDATTSSAVLPRKQT